MNDQRAKDRMLPQDINKGNILFAVLLILGIAIGSHVKTLTDRYALSLFEKLFFPSSWS